MLGHGLARLKSYLQCSRKNIFEWAIGRFGFRWVVGSTLLETWEPELMLTCRPYEYVTLYYYACKNSKAYHSVVDRGLGLGYGRGSSSRLGIGQKDKIDRGNGRGLKNKMSAYNSIKTCIFTENEQCKSSFKTNNRYNINNFLVTS